MEEMVGKNFNRQRKNVITDNNPCFFKFVQPDFSTVKLIIPCDFQKHILPIKSKSRRAIIKDSAGGAWEVALVEDGDDLVLVDGWTQFVGDHSIRPPEVLLFGYEGNMTFHVQIFEGTGMERVISKGHDQAHSLELPYFEKHLLDFNVNTPFQLEHLPREKTKMTLQNSKGKAWSVTLLVNGKMHRLCGGWRNFVQENKLKLGDLCKFELMDVNTIMVHRVASRPAS